MNHEDLPLPYLVIMDGKPVFFSTVEEADLAAREFGCATVYGLEAIRHYPKPLTEQQRSIVASFVSDYAPLWDSFDHKDAVEEAIGEYLENATDEQLIDDVKLVFSDDARMELVEMDKSGLASEALIKMIEEFMHEELQIQDSHASTELKEKVRAYRLERESQNV